ncbi:hypothetical protein KIW84_062057 [Lathyrus oleraceus]|uniref:Uncharacterized protein n=1 Tax=Pisum sativum TaxID=3888 RepID=A0A9D4W5F9_PEA|nr:hypothetical protein KIW84_062057 [Pisum sativum]
MNKVSNKINDLTDEILIIKKLPKKGNKLPKNSSSVPFHFEESTIKWNFGYYRRMSFDKLYVKALKYNDIVELPSDAQLLKTILNAGACYPELVGTHATLEYG